MLKFGMKLVLILVSSLDGITNQGENENHHSWTSEEDKDLFNKARDNAKLIIMGSRTYSGAKEFMIHKDDRKRVVLTNSPEKYNKEVILGKLEFTNEQPNKLIQRLEKEGYNEGLLVGGATTNTLFFKEKLVTELWITIEPWLKGDGLRSIIEKINVPLQLLSFEKINNKGTLHLKYKVTI